MVVFALIWGALMSTEQLSIHLLPAMIEQFTVNPTTIALILFINPAFGFIAQPIVGVLGDKIWTPVGRRAFFLITGAPIVAICLWFVPEARFLWHLVVLVVVYQFFQDVLWGSDHPLLADLFPPKQRLFVSGMLITAGQLTTLVFLRFGMKHLDSDELFRLVAVIQVAFVTGLSFFLNEKPVVKKDRPKLDAKRYVLDLLGDPTRRKFAILYFVLSMVMNLAVLGGYLRLFAIHNLGLDQAEYGETFWVSTVPPLLLSVPMAIVVERFLSKRFAMLVGIACILTSLSIGWTAQSADHLFWLAILWGFGYMITIVTFKPFFSEYVPSDILGQVSGALNICWGLGRAIAVLGAGIIIDNFFDDNYRYIFPLSIVLGVVSIWIAARIPDLRFEARKLGKEPESADTTTA